jgi:CheY-like chemotaxis protein
MLCNAYIHVVHCNLQVLKHMLQRLGVQQVHACDRGDSALQALIDNAAGPARDRFTLVITDIQVLEPLRY